MDYPQFPVDYRKKWCGPSTVKRPAVFSQVLDDTTGRVTRLMEEA